MTTHPRWFNGYQWQHEANKRQYDALIPIQKKQIFETITNTEDIVSYGSNNGELVFAIMQSLQLNSVLAGMLREIIAKRQEIVIAAADAGS